MPKIRVLIAAGGDRRGAFARALGVHAARPRVEVGAAGTRAELISQLMGKSWNVMLIDQTFDGRDSSEVIVAASELLRSTRVIVLGLTIGLAAAAVLARSISTFLYGVQPLDPVTFGAVTAVVAIMAVVATAAPALRALRLDPVVALRSD